MLGPVTIVTHTHVIDPPCIDLISDWFILCPLSRLH